MQLKFLAVFLFVGACCTQLTFAHPQQTTHQRNVVDDLIAKAKEAIEQIQNIIKQKLNESLEVLNKFKDQVNDIAQVAIDEAKEKLNEVIANAQKQIDEIKQKADEVGADISACLADNEERFNDLLNKFLQDEINCITKEVDEAMRIIDEAIQIVTDAWKSVEDLPEKLEACGTKLSSVPCIEKVIVDVAKLEKDLPNKIATKVAEVSTFVAGLKARVESCATSQVANAGLEAAKVVADVAICAAKQTVKYIV